VEIGSWSADDADALFNIYARIFGDKAAAARRASWHWQYHDNPRSPHPVVWVARDARQPLGQLGTMPVALWWAGSEVAASWGVDYFVAPEREGLGYSIDLVKSWMKNVDVALAVGLARGSYLICKRLGFRDLGYVPYYEAVLDPSASARRRWGAVAGALARPLKPLGRLRRPRPPRDVEVRPAAQVGHEYDALWIAARETYAVCVRRDAAYVNWKYAAATHKRYAILEARRHDRLTGFAVTRHEDYRGLRIGWIVDLFTAAGDQPSRDALLSAAVTAFDRAGVARVQAFAAHHALGEDLLRHGFMRRPSRSHLVARSTGVDERPLLSPRDWHVVFGDADSDR
jgi:hypothetical protein